MPFDRPHFYFTFGGTQLGVSEIWQTGLRYAPDATREASDLLDALGSISVQDCFDDVAAVISGAMPCRYGNQTFLKWAKVAVIGEDGHYAGEPKLHEGSVAGQLASANGAPPQLALVVSYGTGTSFGKAQRGRQYWPLPIDVITAVASTTGQLPQATVDTFRTAVKTAMNAVEGEIGTVDVPVSAAVMSPSGTGTTKFITEIGVGRIIDTQRRRRNELTEATVAVAF